MVEAGLPLFRRNHSVSSTLYDFLNKTLYPGVELFAKTLKKLATINVE